MDVAPEFIEVENQEIESVYSESIQIDLDVEIVEIPDEEVVSQIDLREEEYEIIIEIIDKN